MGYIQPMKRLKIKYMATGDLQPYERNARTHSDHQIDQIVASIEAFGWTNPILVDEHGGIIAGHGRHMAAERMGIEQIPVVTLAGLTDTQKRALVIADNRLALNAGWDTDLLGKELAAIEDDDFDLSILGFDDLELADLLDDEAPDLSGGDGESASGVAGDFITFRGKKIPLTDEEAEWFGDKLESYIEEFGASHGFIGSLMQDA